LLNFTIGLNKNTWCYLSSDSI